MQSYLWSPLKFFHLKTGQKLEGGRIQFMIFNIILTLFVNVYILDSTIGPGKLDGQGASQQCFCHFDLFIYLWNKGLHVQHSKN